MIVRGFTGGVFVQNTYLVSCVGSGKAILVDPGAAVGEALRVAEESSLEIVEIVLTHAHIDHVDGAAEAKRGPGAPIPLPPAAEQLYDAAPLQGRWFGGEIEAPPPLDGTLSDGQLVTFGSCELE